MLYEMSNFYKGMEQQALQAGAFVDFEIATASKGYAAVTCTVTSNDNGKRYVRMAEDANVSIAQEHAGIMALCAFMDQQLPNAKAGNAQKAEAPQQAHTKQEPEKAPTQAAGNAGIGPVTMQEAKPATNGHVINMPNVQGPQDNAAQMAPDGNTQRPAPGNAAPQRTQQPTAAETAQGQRQAYQNARSQAMKPQPQQPAAASPRQNGQQNAATAQTRGASGQRAQNAQGAGQRPVPQQAAQQTGSQRPAPMNAQAQQPQNRPQPQSRPQPQNQAAAQQKAQQKPEGADNAARAADDRVVSLGKYNGWYISDIVNSEGGLKFIKIALNIKNAGANQAHKESVDYIKAYVANRPELQAAIENLSSTVG